VGSLRLEGFCDDAVRLDIERIKIESPAPVEDRVLVVALSKPCAARLACMFSDQRCILVKDVPPPCDARGGERDGNHEPEPYFAQATPRCSLLPLLPDCGAEFVKVIRHRGTAWQNSHVVPDGG